MPRRRPIGPQVARMARLGHLAAAVAANPSIAALIAAAAAQYGVDPTLALAVAQRESNLNPNAISSAGAIGVMQLMPATAASLGVDPHNVAENIGGGVRYLAMLLQQFGGDTTAAVAAYNWGPGNVASAQAQYGSSWLSYAPAETQNYVAALGLTPAPASPMSPAPVTIDAETGDVIPPDQAVASFDSTDVTAAGLVPAGMTPTQIALLGAAAIGIYLLSEYL